MPFPFALPVSHKLEQSATSTSTEHTHLVTFDTINPPFRMSKTTTKTSYTNDEDAFIIAYADVCIERNLDYQATVADELRKVSGRYPAWSNLKRKIGKTLKTLGKAAVKLEVFIDEGTECLEINSFPPAVFTQINQVRSNWGLEPLSNNNTGTSKRDTTASNTLPVGQEYLQTYLADRLISNSMKTMRMRRQHCLASDLNLQRPK